MKGYDKKKGITMASKVEDTNKQNMPGPGTYGKKDFVTLSMSKTSSKKGFFALESRDKQMTSKELLTNPPPGLYNVKSRFDGKKGVLIATKTETVDKNANPGPGSY